MKCPFSKVVFLCTVTLVTLQIRRLSNKKQQQQQQQNSSEDKEDDDNKVEEETNKMSTSSSKVVEEEKEKYPVVFVLGGPGAGKGTQCELLSKRLEGGDVWAHFSAGDLLRAERKKSNSEIGNLINEKIQNGQIVPAEITVQLLQNAMTSATSTQKKKKFLIDGFPRSDGNVTVWNELVENVQAETKFVLFLDCPEDEMMERILERGKTSGRNDDNVETLRKRFQTFRKESMPIVEMYGEKVKKVKADRDIEEVYSDVAKLFEGI